MRVEHGGFKGWGSGPGVEALRQVLREHEKTKRMLIGAACLLFCVAAVVVIFAPPQKQALAYTLGAALLVMALGAIGAAQFTLKAPGVTIEANQTDRPVHSGRRRKPGGGPPASA